MTKKAKAKDDHGFDEAPAGSKVEKVPGPNDKKEPKAPPKPKKVNDCECGCGAKVVKRFKQGHDAKLKSALLAVVTHGTKDQEQKARKRLEKLGWSHFINEDKLNTARKRADAAMSMLA